MPTREFGRAGAVASLLVAAVLVCGSATAQLPVVQEVSSTTVVLFSGEPVPWEVGLTGRLCTTRVVEGAELEVCPVGIELIRVARDTAEAEIKGGDASSVRVGFVARLDGLETATTLTIRSNVLGDSVWVDGEEKGGTPVVIPAVPETPYAVRVVKAGYRDWEQTVSVAMGESKEVWARLQPEVPSPDVLLAQANESFDNEDYERAALLFRQFERSYPNDENVGYARKLAAASEQAVATRDGSLAEDAAELAGKARRFLQAGLVEEALAAANQALELQPDNAEALQVVEAAGGKETSPAAEDGGRLVVGFRADTGAADKIQVSGVEYRLFSSGSGEVVESGSVTETPVGDWFEERVIEVPAAGVYRLQVTMNAGQLLRGDWRWNSDHKKHKPAAQRLDEVVHITGGESAVVVMLTARKNVLQGGLKWMPLKTDIELSER